MELYYLPYSAPCRSVVMTAKALGLQMKLTKLNLPEGEHLKPEFLKLNPQHTIPTLVDDGLVLWESRAILTYLVEKYGGNNKSLYPDDPKQRAIINQRLYFDMGTLYKSFGDYYYPQMRFNKPADPELYKKMEEAFDFFNTFLEGQKFAVGNTLTIADFALLATVSTFDVAGFDISKYPNVVRWYEAAKKVTPGFQETYEALLAVKDRYKRK